MRLTVNSIEGDYGSVVRFHATDDEGRAYLVSADHRPAADIIDALARKEQPVVDPPEWAVRRA